MGFSQLPGGLGFGGAAGARGHFALYVEPSLDSGMSRPIATFGNSSSLASEQVFQVRGMGEVAGGCPNHTPALARLPQPHALRTPSPSLPPHSRAFSLLAHAYLYCPFSWNDEPPVSCRQIDTLECWLLQPPEDEDAASGSDNNHGGGPRRGGGGSSSILDKAAEDRAIMKMAGMNLHSEGVRDEPLEED